MKTRTIFQLILLGISFLPTLAYTQNFQNSIFWKISGNGLEKPSYLFGTHHLYNYEFIKKNQEIHQLLKSVDVVVGELVIDNQGFEMAAKMMGAVMMKDQTLDKLLTAEEFKEVDNSLRKYSNISLKFFNNFKPSFVQQLITVSKFVKTSEKNTSNNPDFMQGSFGNPMDAYFQEIGRKEGKEIKGLETIDEQLSIMLDPYPLDKQVKMLLEAVRKSEEADIELFTKSNELYQKQDIQTLYAMMKESTSDDELRILLIDRNVKWIPQLKSLFAAQKSAFIAVGAGHLPGEFGILNLLAQHGYTLTPIPIVIE